MDSDGRSMTGCSLISALVITMRVFAECPLTWLYRPKEITFQRIFRPVHVPHGPTSEAARHGTTDTVVVGVHPVVWHHPWAYGVDQKLPVRLAGALSVYMYIWGVWAWMQSIVLYTWVWV